MGMDKIDNVKSAIASATAVDSKKRPGIVTPASNNEGRQAGVVPSTAVNPVSRSKSVSTVSSKTLTETLSAAKRKSGKRLRKSTVNW